MAVSTVLTAARAARGPSVRAAEPCATCEARAVSVCSVVRDQDLERLAQAAVQVRAGRGRAIVQRGEPAEAVFNITAGVVRLSKTLPDDRRQVVGFLFPGDFLGFAAHEAYSYDAEAVTEVRACRFQRNSFLELLAAFPAMERRLLCMASHDIQEAQDQMVLLGRKSAKERMGSFLLKMAERTAKTGGDPGLAQLPMARADISDYLGLTPETVSRSLAQLKSEGLVRLEGAHSVRLLDPAALARLAEAEFA